MMPTDLAWNLIAIVALGMAVAVSVVDYSSRSTRLLATLFLLLGTALLLEANFLAGRTREELPSWANWATLPGSLSLIILAEWLKLIRRTAQQPTLDTRGEQAIRYAQVLAVTFGVAEFSFPEWRAEYLLRIMDQPEVLLSWQFHVLAIPFAATMALLFVALLQTLWLQPDPPERLRLIGVAIALPFIFLAFITPREIAPYCAITGEMVLLVAIMQYHMQWGQRGQFMSRFLSPQVAAAVRDYGLDEAMHEDRLELSAVACDIRGFSSFAEQQDSGEVLSLLKRYYDTIGEIAALHGATIKDYAGDGVLLLLGAPLPDSQHAEHALSLALDIRERCQPLWQDNELGLGIGIATGLVNVGLVGTQPMEYAAVGRAINLASRLCDHAGDGQILVSERTRELANLHEDQFQLQSSQKVQFKGLAEPVHVWAIHPDAQTLQRIKKSRTQRRRGFFRMFG